MRSQVAGPNAMDNQKIETCVTERMSESVRPERDSLQHKDHIEHRRKLIQMVKERRVIWAQKGSGRIRFKVENQLKQAYEEIAQAIGVWSAARVRREWKRLKTAYVVIQKRLQNGEQFRTSLPFYSDLHDILGDCNESIAAALKEDTPLTSPLTSPVPAAATPTAVRSAAATRAAKSAAGVRAAASTNNQEKESSGENDSCAKAACSSGHDQRNDSTLRSVCTTPAQRPSSQQQQQQHVDPARLQIARGSTSTVEHIVNRTPALDSSWQSSLCEVAARLQRPSSLCNKQQQQHYHSRGDGSAVTMTTMASGNPAFSVCHATTALSTAAACSRSGAEAFAAWSQPSTPHHAAHAIHAISTATGGVHHGSSPATSNGIQQQQADRPVAGMSSAASIAMSAFAPSSSLGLSRTPTPASCTRGDSATTFTHTHRTTELEMMVARPAAVPATAASHCQCVPPCPHPVLCPSQPAAPFPQFVNHELERMSEEQRREVKKKIFNLLLSHRQ
eukprot:scpid64577/ scgid31451/ 